MRRTGELILTATFRLDLHPDSGVTVEQAAHDAYLLQRATGVDVEIIHNDHRYSVKLETKELAMDEGRRA